MKKIFTAILAIMLVLSLSACGGEEYEMHLDTTEGYYYMNGDQNTGEGFGFLSDGNAVYVDKNGVTAFQYTRSSNTLTFQNLDEHSGGKVAGDDSIEVDDYLYIFAEADYGFSDTDSDDESTSKSGADSSWYGTFKNANGTVTLEEETVLEKAISFVAQMDDEEGSYLSDTLRLNDSGGYEDDTVSITLGSDGKTLTVTSLKTFGNAFAGTYVKE